MLGPALLNVVRSMPGWYAAAVPTGATHAFPARAVVNDFAMPCSGVRPSDRTFAESLARLAVVTRLARPAEVRTIRGDC